MKKLFIVMLGLLMTGCYKTKEGVKTGVIIKFAQEGMIWKTNEAEMVRGGFSQGSGVQGSAFDFTVEDPNLIPKVQEAVDNQYEVRIKYRKEFVAAPWRSAPDYFLEDITVLNVKKMDTK